MSKSIEELATELTVAYLTQNESRHISTEEAVDAFSKFSQVIKKETGHGDGPADVNF